jgi:hypothetical protein
MNHTLIESLRLVQAQTIAAIADGTEEMFFPL